MANAPVVLWSTHGSEEAERQGLARSRACTATPMAWRKPRSKTRSPKACWSWRAAATISPWPRSTAGHLRNDPDQSIMGYVYTDRPVYRPGHTVHFRAILRNEMPTGYQIPDRERGAGPGAGFRRQAGLSAHAAAFPAMGTVHGDFDLPAAAALGYYGIEIHAGEANAGGGFNVEEYKKPEYEVKVTPSKKRVVQGEAIQATIEAKYYYGEPVANAQGDVRGAPLALLAALVPR